MALLLLLCAMATFAAAPKGDWLPLPGRVWTADGDAAQGGRAGPAYDGAITAIGPAASIAAPPGTRRVELPGTTLIPGLNADLAAFTGDPGTHIDGLAHPVFVMKDGVSHRNRAATP